MNENLLEKKKILNSAEKKLKLLFYFMKIKQIIKTNIKALRKINY